MYSSPRRSYFTSNHDPDLPWLLKQRLQPAVNLLDQVIHCHESGGSTETMKSKNINPENGSLVVVIRGQSLGGGVRAK